MLESTYYVTLMFRYATAHFFILFLYGNIHVCHSLSFCYLAIQFTVFLENKDTFFILYKDTGAFVLAIKCPVSLVLVTFS